MISVHSSPCSVALWQQLWRTFLSPQAGMIPLCPPPSSWHPLSPTTGTHYPPIPPSPSPAGVANGLPLGIRREGLPAAATFSGWPRGKGSPRAAPTLLHLEASGSSCVGLAGDSNSKWVLHSRHSCSLPSHLRCHPLLRVRCWKENHTSTAPCVASSCSNSHWNRELWWREREQGFICCNHQQTQCPAKLLLTAPGLSRAGIVLGPLLCRSAGDNGSSRWVPLSFQFIW